MANLESSSDDGYLIGDSGYPCSSTLLTPLQNVVTEAKRRYNASHIKTRNIIERLFGVWKSRFQCLRNEIRFSPIKCCNVIIATAVLHNFAKFQNEIEPLHVTDNTSLNNNMVSHSQNRSAVRQIFMHFNVCF